MEVMIPIYSEMELWFCQNDLQMTSITICNDLAGKHFILQNAP